VDSQKEYVFRNSIYFGRLGIEVPPSDTLLRYSTCSPQPSSLQFIYGTVWLGKDSILKGTNLSDQVLLFEKVERHSSGINLNIFLLSLAKS
jgi:hypothetical protein